MNTTHLRFPDEATAQTVLSAYRATDDSSNSQWVVASLVHALDPIGVMYTPGTYDAQGSQLTAPVAIDGWHVNFIGDLPAAAQPYVINPKTPSVVFAGAN